MTLRASLARAAATFALACVAALFLPIAAAAPALERIKMATVAAEDVAEVERRYTTWLGYKVRERGKVPRELARSWGAPKAAGRDYILMSPDGHPDVFIRVVQTPSVPGYKPLTTFGWNAIEIIVDDPYKLFESFKASPFEHIGGPASLGSAYPTIHAFQVVGSAAEVLYLTSELGDRSKSVIPTSQGPVGRIFIMVLASADAQATIDWYAEKFSMQKNPLRMRPLKLLTKAQNLPEDRPMPIATMRLAEHGNLIEFDGYSENATVRPRVRGELPTSIAITSFSVRDLDALKLDYISRPAVRPGLAYQGRRSATVVGPTGELIELIEESPPASPVR